MIGGLVVGGDDARLATGVGCRLGEHGLEEGGREGTGAGECREKSAGTQQFECEQVNILVGPAGALKVGLRFCEFRRIENDQIECPAGIAGGSEKLEDICLDDFEAIGFGDAVSGEIGLEGGQCGIGSVDLRDMLCAILEACETKTAIVAECIEHISIAGEFSDERMVKRLIEIGAGFLSIRDIDDGPNAIAEADFDGIVIRVCAGAPCEFAAFRGQPFAGSSRGIGAFVDSDDVREEIEEDFGENLAEGFEPGRENLNAQDVIIAVDDETGETIGFSVDDSERISVGGALEEAPAVGGVVDLISEPVRSRKRRIVTEGEHPDADLGSRGEKSDSKRCILRGGEDAHECTGFERFSVCIGWYICDCAGEDPRVVPQEGTFAAGFEANSGQEIAHGRGWKMCGDTKTSPPGGIAEGEDGCGWSQRSESNRQPTDYKSVALPLCYTGLRKTGRMLSETVLLGKWVLFGLFFGRIVRTDIQTSGKAMDTGIFPDFGMHTIGTLFMKWTVSKFRASKGHALLPCVTAYDYITGRIADRAGVPLVLVGDSLCMTALGHSTTIPATMDIMVHHAECVHRAVRDAIVVGDMPFLTYTTEKQALANAGRFLQEAGVDAVKIEGGVTHASIIKRLTDNGIPVMAHIGMLPQSVKEKGYAIRGRTPEDVEKLMADLDAVSEAGAFAVTLEGVLQEVATEMTARCPVPTIGIGAGNGCDGQFLVLADLLGLGEGPLPKFAKSYAKLGDAAVAAIQAYASDVCARSFPDAEHVYEAVKK